MKKLFLFIFIFTTILNAIDFSIERYIPKEPLYQGYIQGFYKIILATKEDGNTVRYVYAIDQNKFQEVYKKATQKDIKLDIRMTRNFVNRIMKEELKSVYCNDIDYRMDIEGALKPSFHYIYFNAKNQFLSDFLFTPASCQTR